MPIRDDIMTTDPWLYYPLDDGTTTDIGSNGHNATLAGSTDLTVLGVEAGKTALHLGTTGSLVSTALGMTTMPDFTLACYIMMQPIAAWNAFRALITMGVPGGVAGANWGAALGLNGANGGAPMPVGAVYPWSIFASGPNPSGNPNFWHHIAMVYTASTHGVVCYVDGVSASGQTNTNAAPFKTSDALQLSWPSGQMVVAHVAFWRQALTVAQIGGFGAYATSWPQNQAFQTGGGGGGTVTIGSPQDAQLDDIQAKVADIPGIVDAINFISSTVNTIKGTTDTILSNVNAGFSQVADWLNGLVTDVTGKITTAAGDVGITIGQWISQHSHDQWGVFSVTGGTTCTDIHWPAGGTGYFGCAVQIDSYPAEWTFTTPADDWSIRDLAVITFTIGGELVGRHGVHTQTMEFQQMPGAFPAAVGTVGVDILPPGYVIDVYWAGGVCGQLLLYYWP